MAGRLKASEYLALFILAALTDLAGNLVPLPLLHYTVKPLLMPLLAAALLTKLPVAPRSNLLLLCGLLLSWAGDILLLFEYKGSIFFIAGLAAFLCAHLAYIVFFLKIKGPQPSLLKTQPLLTPAALVFTGSLIVLLYPRLDTLRIPVLLYAAVITLMLLCSLHAFTRLKAPANALFAAGAIAFVLSDSLLAINKFYKPFAFAGALIMLTYCIAQFCLVKGAISRSS